MNASSEVIAHAPSNAKRMRSGEPFEEVLQIDPLQYPAWDSLVGAHSESSAFHGTGWARVLRDTYGHRPVYFTRFADGHVKELLPVMEVSSPLTGRRGVSLPFTDFCCSLRSGAPDYGRLHELAKAHGVRRGWKYLECRSGRPVWKDASPSLAFHGHTIDLAAGEAAIYQRLDGSVRRGIRKARNAGLQVEFTHTIETVRVFYKLHCRTRRRHGLPPQPLRFFECIAQHMLTPGHGFVATAKLDQAPLAAMIFFRHGRQAIYKYGASDYAFQHLRPNNLVMWESIKFCARTGCETLHLGRTSLTNESLRRFKLGFGAHEERIEYFRYGFAERAFVTDVDRSEGWFNRIFRCMPLLSLRLAGEILYPHLS
jgi:GNAT acetyltransferase-like protein